MCGIAGIFLKDRKLEPELGALLAGMLGPLCDRGPDSAGFAVYGEATPNHCKLTLRARDGFDFERMLRDLDSAVSTCRIHDTHLVITVPRDREAVVVAEIRRHRRSICRQRQTDGDLQGSRAAG